MLELAPSDLLVTSQSPRRPTKPSHTSVGSPSFGACPGPTRWNKVVPPGLECVKKTHLCIILCIYGEWLCSTPTYNQHQPTIGYHRYHHQFEEAVDFPSPCYKVVNYTCFITHHQKPRLRPGPLQCIQPEALSWLNHSERTTTIG